jgi:CubicO group peptidase (beta-lactamase class C family)
MNPQVTLANWRTAPFNRWAFHHVRELIPTADIPNDPRRVRELPAEKADLAPLRIEPDAGEAMGIEAFLQETDTDGLAILHRGRLAFERYANGMSDETPHIFMSVSKSMLGLLIHEIGLDTTRPVADFVPQVKGTAYRDAKVRDLLDMRAGIVWNEDYLASGGPIVEYRKATGWNPLGAGETPSDLKSFYVNLRETAPHGGPVHYVSPNSDLLGWVVENATGERYATVMSTLVWKKAGTERSAYITVDRLGAPRCAGGMCSTLRDLARVGQWLLEERQGFLQEIETGGDPEAWAAGDLAAVFRGLPMRYRSQWYVLEAKRGEKAAPLVFGWGIHGQHLFIDRRNEIVIARFASQSLPVDAARIALLLRTVSEIRKHFS